MKKVLLIIIFIYTGNVISQEIKIIKDFGVWGGISFEKEVLSNYSLTLETQVRTFHNTSKLDDYILNSQLKYSINKKFDLAGGLRYILDFKRINGIEHNVRYNIDLEYKNKLTKKLRVRYRLRYQQEFVNPYLYINFFFTNNVQRIYSSSIRNRIKLNFKYTEQHNVYSSFEIFRLFEVFREPYFNKIRVFVGDKMKLFDVAIGFEKELNSNHPYSFVFLKTVYTLKK
ncbi:MAG: hypothetical protein CMP56_03935 [Flavobacteriales bacterium]|nr:hypothetical protein [Flavobacteriales bacterium]|tara:strand:+ start:2303 stop:2986 length:684 start_codon:yes stop_codon:yes gene_type:complete